MKIVLERQLLQIGSGGLRCGRWAVKHRKNKKEAAEVLWHTGKFYAYMYSLIILDCGVELLDRNKVYKIEEFLKNYRVEKIHLFPSLFTGYVFLMDKGLFDMILESKQPHQGPRIVKEIRKLCPIIT